MEGGCGRKGIMARYQGDTIHPFEISTRRKIARASDNPTVYHTTRLCEKLFQPKSDFDLTDPRGFLISSEYNSLHDPNLKNYLYRKDIHRRLVKRGFITKDDKVICSLKSLNKYRDYLADVERDWTRRFRMEQKDVVRLFLTLQEQGRITSDMSVADLTNWVLQSNQSSFVNPSKVHCSKFMPGLKPLPAILARRNAITPCESEVVWGKKGAQIMAEVVKEVQREMRVERPWLHSKKMKTKKRGRQNQKKLKKVQSLSIAQIEKDSSLSAMSHEAVKMPQPSSQEREGSRETLGGQGEPSKSLEVTPTQTASPRGDLAQIPDPFEKKEGSGLNVDKSASPQKRSRQATHQTPDPILSLSAEDIIRAGQHIPPERNISIGQRPFSDAKKKLSAICLKLVTESATTLGPTTECGLKLQMAATKEISSRLVDIQETFLEEHFRGMVTPEELQMVLRGMVVTLVEEVNKILIPAIISFENERRETSSPAKDSILCLDEPSPTTTSSKMSGTTRAGSASASLTPDVEINYPDYALQDAGNGCESGTQPPLDEMWCTDGGSPEIIQNLKEREEEEERRSLGMKVVGPTAGLLLKVEGIIKDMIRDSADIIDCDKASMGTTPLTSVPSDAKGAVILDVKSSHVDLESAESAVVTESRARIHIRSDSTATSDDETSKSGVSTDLYAKSTDVEQVELMTLESSLSLEGISTQDVSTARAASVVKKSVSEVHLDAKASEVKCWVDSAEQIYVEDDSSVDISEATSAITFEVTAADTIDTTSKDTGSCSSDSWHNMGHSEKGGSSQFIGQVEEGGSSHLIGQLEEGMAGKHMLAFRTSRELIGDLHPDLRLGEVGREGEEAEEGHLGADSVADWESGFVVSLEKSVKLSSDQVDEILDKVACILEEEQICWSPSGVTSDIITSEECTRANMEAVSPPPRSVIFAIIQKMQLDRYLERKLVSFFAGRQSGSSDSTGSRPMSSYSLDDIWQGAPEGFSRSAMKGVNSHSIKVTKWLLETIQKRNQRQATVTPTFSTSSSTDEFEVAENVQRLREKHLLGEVIQSLLDHLEEVSAIRQTQSEGDVRSGGVMPGASVSHNGPVRMGATVSDMSLVATELTKDVMAKLLHDDTCQQLA